MTKSTANLLLLIDSLFWGSGFIAIKMVLDANVSVGFINFFRGTIFTLLTLLFFYKQIFHMTRKEFKLGLLAGLFNFSGFITQTIGLLYTTPSNNAFLSNTYVILIPVIAWLFYRKKLTLKSVFSIFICFIGMLLLTWVPGNRFTLNIGDAYSFISAFFYAGSIVLLSYGSRQTQASAITFMLAAVQAVGGFIYFLVEQTYSIAHPDWAAAILPLLYLALICSFAAQTIQVVAQKHTSAIAAGLIMMLESVFGSIFSIAFGYDKFTFNLISGGLLITFSLILMELNGRKMRLIFRQCFHLKSN